MKVGYARVSSTDQDYQIQHDALVMAGAEKVFAEKASGTSTKGRTALQEALEFVREGDVLVVTRIDRLARSLRDLQNIVHDLQAKGVHLSATEQPIDTGSAAGKAFLGMLGVFGEFETAIRRERQLEGIAAAKAKGGVYKGRKSVQTRDLLEQIAAAVAAGEKKAAVAERLGIGRATLYRALETLKESGRI